MTFNCEAQVSLMDPGTQLSLFTGAWRYPGIQPGLSGMDLSQVSQAAYRYNQNMMEYYTCKSKSKEQNKPHIR